MIDNIFSLDSFDRYPRCFSRYESDVQLIDGHNVCLYMKVHSTDVNPNCSYMFNQQSVPSNI